MRVGVIGVGVAGSSHLFDLASSEDFEITAVCAARPGHAAEAAAIFGARTWCRTAEEVIADESIEAVVIATPPDVAPAILDRAIDAGLPTLVEKPAAASAARLRSVIQRAGPKANLARVAYNRRYQRHVAHAAALTRGSPGAVSEIRCCWRAPFAARYGAGHSYRTASRFGDGVILDTATHIFDTLLYLGNPPLTVTSADLRACQAEADVEARLTLTGGSLLVRVEVTDAGSDDDWEMEISASWGHLTLSAGGLLGDIGGEKVSVDGGYFHRPVEDLLLGNGTARGATLAEAVTDLELVDQARARAAPRSRADWRRPRAKALGRLNGAC